MDGHKGEDGHDDEAKQEQRAELGRRFDEFNAAIADVEDKEKNPTYESRGAEEANAKAEIKGAEEKLQELNSQYLKHKNAFYKEMELMGREDKQFMEDKQNQLNLLRGDKK